MPDKHPVDRDMSEAAINRRMQKLSELYQFWRSVERARSGQAEPAVREEKGEYGPASPSEGRAEPLNL